MTPFPLSVINQYSNGRPQNPGLENFSSFYQTDLKSSPVFSNKQGLLKQQVLL